MEKKTGFQLNWISRYRDELFGIAILMVMFFHFTFLHVGYYEGSSKLSFRIIDIYYRYIKSGGVDIFVFLSGMGLYYSFSKNSDLGRFYARRYKRILIPYAIIGGIFWLRYDIFFKAAGFRRFLEDFFYVTYVREGVNSLWFIFYISIMYLLFPLIYKAAYSKYAGGILSVMMLAAALYLPVIMDTYCHDIYHNINGSVTRIPLFVLGVICGRPIKEGKRIPHLLVLIIAAACIFCRYYTVNNGIKGYLGRYSTGILAMGIMIICVYLLRAMEGAGIIRKVLRFFGEYSLEFYLTHILVWELFSEYGVQIYRTSRYALLVCICLVIAPLLGKLTKALNMLSKRRNPCTGQ